MEHQDSEVVPVNLTAIFEEFGIRKVERFINRFSVVLSDGRHGIGGTVGEALNKALAPGADNIKQVAA